MGEYMLGTWLYTFITMLPFGIWSLVVLYKERWIFSKEKNSNILGAIMTCGLAYQVLLPLYWCFYLSPKGL